MAIQNPFLQHSWVIGILIAVVVLRALLGSPVIKGHLGERWLRSVAARRLDRKLYHALHDVTLPTSRGSSQIDHLFVSVYGLFVVETKNMSGRIFGREHEPRWTQKLGRSHVFPNPIQQNHGHCKAVIELLGLPPERIHSVVCFVGDARFGTAMPPEVTRRGGCIRYIKSLRTPVFTPTEVARILADIERLRLPPGTQTRRQHIASVKARRARRAR